MNDGHPGLLPSSVVAFLVLSAAAGSGALRRPDLLLMRLAQARTCATADAAGGAVSVLGRAPVAAAALGVLAVSLRLRGRGRLGLRLLLGLFVTTLAEVGLKFTLPQPPIPEDARRVPDPSPVDLDAPYPYPSGHMLRAVILLGAAYALRPSKTLGALLGLVLAIAAAARVYLGTHWPSDVLGGALLGVAALAWAFDEE